MSWGKIYEGYFKDVNNNSYTVRISREGAPGTTYKELLLADDPVIIEYAANEDVYKPLKESGCQINVLTPNVLTDIYSGNNKDILIQILKNEGGQLKHVWMGLNTPNNYSSEFSTSVDSMTIEAIDVLSSMKYYKYEKSGNDYALRSFHYLIADIVSRFSSGAFPLVSKIYYYCNYNNDAEILHKLKVDEQNWFDEDDQAATLEEVLEHICQFLGVQAVMLNGNELHMIPIDGFIKAEGTFTVVEYDTQKTSTWYKVVGNKTFTRKTCRVAEDSASVSIGNVYNQINVIANIIEIEPEIINIESSDNDHLIPFKHTNNIATTYIAKVIYNKDCEGQDDTSWNGEDSHKYFGTYYKRDDCTLNLPGEGIFEAAGTFGHAFIEMEGYDGSQPKYPINGELPDGKSYIERYAKIDNAISSEYTVSSVDFKNNICFKIGTYGPLPSIGMLEYAPLPFDVLATANKYIAAPNIGNVIFQKKLRPQSYMGGDFLVVSFDFKYSSQANGLWPINGGAIAFRGEEILSFTNGWSILNYYPALIQCTNGSTPPFCLKVYLRLGNKYFTNVDYQQGEWVSDMKPLFIFGKFVANESSADQTFKVYNTNRYYEMTSDSIEGLLIRIPSDVYGELELQITNAMLKPCNANEIEVFRPWLKSNNYDLESNLIYKSGKKMKNLGHESYEVLNQKWNKEGYYLFGNKQDSNDYTAKVKYGHISDLTVKYITRDDLDFAQIRKENKNNDLKYSAVIDMNNVVEYEDKTLYLNTYNPEKNRKLSYSYVLYDFNGAISNVKNLSKWGESLRPEEHCVQMYVEHYKNPRIQYTNTIIQDGIDPVDMVKPVVDENDYKYMDKTFIVGNYQYNVRYNNINLTMIEL